MKIPTKISELQKGLVKKEYSCVELVDEYLARIKKYDRELNAFNTVCEEVAYKQARENDRYLTEAGEEALRNRPLLGVVAAHKDLFCTKGVRSTASSKVLKSYVPSYSATVVTKMEEAGVIMIGKTNHDAWGHGSSGENSDFGPTHNPWKKGYVPGGSSSGSAAAVAAGMVMVATGSDTGSSVRLPASFCNLVGLKPTYGAVSRYGVIAMASSLDSVGCMTRTVEDCEKVFGIMKGEDGRDSTINNSKLKIRNSKQIINSKFQISKIKLGVPREYFEEGIDREVREKVEEAIKVYKDQRMVIKEVSLPHTRYAISTYYIIQPAEVSSNLSRYDGVRYGSPRENFGDEAKRRMMLGTYVLSAGYYDAYYLKAMKVRKRIIEDFERAFEEVDALIAPVSPTPPFRLGKKTADPLQMYLSDSLTVPANMAGIAGLAIPAGFSNDGLPIGFQLMGPRFAEERLFELGGLYQRETEWHIREPEII